MMQIQKCRLLKNHTSWNPLFAFFLYFSHLSFNEFNDFFFNDHTEFKNKREETTLSLRLHYIYLYIF